MNSIVFHKQQGGLGRPLQGEDNISGLLVYSSSLPTGFSSSAREQVVYGITDAENLGITETAFAIYHYHISEYFRMNPVSALWIGIYAPITNALYTFTEIISLQNAAGGKIRQVAVYAPQLSFTGTFTITVSSTPTNFFDAAQVAALQSVANTLYSQYKPLTILYAPNVPSTTTLASLLDLTAQDADSVSVVIGQDGGAAGKALYALGSTSITCVGAVLGAVSAAKVSENIGWIGKFNFVSGPELDTLAFANGALYSTQSDGTMFGSGSLDAKGYIFLRKHIGITGSYANDSHTCTADTSDYAYLENQRTIQKAIRNMRMYLLPDLSGPLTLNADGTLDPGTATHFQTRCARALDQMQRNGEVSAYKVNVNPAQNVLSTGILTIGVLIVPVGVAREISVNIGFALSTN